LTSVRAGLASSVGRRLLGGTFANLLDKLALLAVQLVAIPLLSHHWGAEGYGTWLMLMTIPTYVAVSDFGLGTAAGVEITQRVARGDMTGALTAFQSAWGLVFAILAVIALATGVYSTLVISTVIGGSADIAIAVLLVALYAIAAVQMTTLAIVYRATHKFARAMLISAVVICLEGVALICVVLLGGHIVEAALAMLAVRVAGWGATYADLRRLEPWVRLGIGSADLTTVRRLAHPSLAALSLTLASSISLQGMVLVLGWVSGPAVAAVFGATRFLARIPLQFSGLVVRASLPELTRAQVESDHTLVRRLKRLNIASSLAPTLPLIPILAVFGPALLRGMTGSELDAQWWLFTLLATTTMLGALWQAVASPLVAANQQSRFAYAYAALSVAAIAAVIVPGVPPLAAAATAALAAELAVTLLVFRLDRQVAGHATDNCVDEPAETPHTPSARQ